MALFLIVAQSRKRGIRRFLDGGRQTTVVIAEGWGCGTCVNILLLVDERENKFSF